MSTLGAIAFIANSKEVVRWVLTEAISPDALTYNFYFYLYGKANASTCIVLNYKQMTLKYLLFWFNGTIGHQLQKLYGTPA